MVAGGCGLFWWGWWRRVFVFVAPGETLGDGLIFCEWEIFVGDGFVVCVRGNFWREVFAPFSCASHVLDDARDERVVFFFRVLFVEDAVLFVFEAGATEDVITIMAFDGVKSAVAVPEEKVGH